jgi:hypothetical protein
MFPCCFNLTHLFLHNYIMCVCLNLIAMYIRRWMCVNKIIEYLCVREMWGTIIETKEEGELSFGARPMYVFL